MEAKSLDHLVNKIFCYPPKPPCTYTIAVAQQLSDHVTLFQLLMTILIIGAKHIYGEHITPNDITSEQFEELKSFIASIGYTLKHNYRKVEGTNVQMINIWFEPIVKKMNCHGIPVYF